MAKLKAIYTCQACGATHARWQGKCDSCGEWNTIVEELPATAAPGSTGHGKARPGQLVDLGTTLPDSPRHPTHSAEFDRVLGGGIVPGAAILIGGDPGIGKSTLLLQAAAHLGRSVPVLYFSGEESAGQIQMRARRLGAGDSPLKLATTAHLETMIATIQSQRPAVVVVDSIQTVFSDRIDSAPGTVSQVRLAAHELIMAGKKSDTTVIFVGHVTKEGQIAGPRVLEHMVDTVLYFEGDRGKAFRILRAFKNRFGATHEIGVFDMTEQGLADVANPSAIFLAERPTDAPGSAVLAAMEGTRPVLIEVQALVSKSTLAQPRRTTLGVDPNRLAMITAVLDKHAGFTFGQHDVFVNLTGGLKVTEPAADMAIAAALISSLLNRTIDPQTIFFGELGLSGEVRSVSLMPARLLEASKLGFNRAITPPPAKGAGAVKGLSAVSINRLADLVAHL